MISAPRGGLALAGRLVLVASLLGGCAAASSGGTPSGGASAAAHPSVSAGGPRLTLAFAGDVHFMKRTADLLRDPKTAMGPITPVLAGSDLTLVNLETAVTERGAPETKRYLFRTDARAVTALRAAGVDAVSAANNHSMDYGRIGLDDTLAAVRGGGLGVFGAGKDAAAAYAPWRTVVRGIRISVLGFSQVEDLADEWAARDGRSGIAMAFDEKRAVAAVAAARKDSDVVIVMPHWGTEQKDCPNGDQRRFAAALVRAGADVVVGAHAHVLQGRGYLDDAYVAYGMGNFLWYSSGLTPNAVRTGVLRLTLHGRTVVENELVPALVSDTGQPVPLSGASAETELARVDRLSRCAGLEPRPKG